MNDAIDHPAHYGGESNPYEAIKVVEAWDLDFYLGNVIKYVSRAGKKADELEDLKKARWYLDRKIARMEAAKKDYRNSSCRQRRFRRSQRGRPRQSPRPALAFSFL